MKYSEEDQYQRRVITNSLEKSGLIVTCFKVVSGSIILVVMAIGTVIALPFVLLASLFKSKN